MINVRLNHLNIYGQRTDTDLFKWYIRNIKSCVYKKQHWRNQLQNSKTCTMNNFTNSQSSIYISIIVPFWLTHALITVYCQLITSIKYVLNNKSLAASRIIKKADPTSPYLAASHRLPVHFRIDFQNVLISLKAVNGSAPACISELPWCSKAFISSLKSSDCSTGHINL